MTGDPPQDPPDLARFLQDWTSLWREEMADQAGDAGMTEMWRTAIALWAKTMIIPPSSFHDGRAQTRTAPAAAASDPRDAEIERLARRVDALEARISQLEAPRRRRS